MLSPGRGSRGLRKHGQNSYLAVSNGLSGSDCSCGVAEKESFFLKS